MKEKCMFCGKKIAIEVPLYDSAICRGCLKRVGYIKALLEIHRRKDWDKTHGCFGVSYLVKAFNVKRIAEIGVCEGHTAAEVLTDNKLEKYYMVDFWFDENVPKSFTQPCIEIIKKRSMDALKQISDNSLDMVYIDARHEYKEVKEDMLHWYKKLKIGGVLVGHDFDHPRHPKFGVKKAACELFRVGEIFINYGGNTLFWVLKQ